MAVPQHARGDKPNLLGMNLAEMTTFFAALGEKPFRAKQVFRWLHQGGVASFDAMTDLAKSLREKLPEVAAIVAPKLMTELTSSDGTRKWLLDVGTGNGIEECSFPRRIAARCACRVRWVARSIAPSARLASRVLIAISRRLKSLVNCGGRTRRWVATRRANALSRTS